MLDKCPNIVRLRMKKCPQLAQAHNGGVSFTFQQDNATIHFESAKDLQFAISKAWSEVDNSKKGKKTNLKSKFNKYIMKLKII
uniref:Uncharacterized protein n=1 Tax=Heterorhabditis bacteriophora TaxID=37862 RepID=A0A1I7W6S7_HETBA